MISNCKYHVKTVIIRFLSLFLVKLGLYFILGPIFGQKCFIVKFNEESWILKKQNPYMVLAIRFPDIHVIVRCNEQF